MKKDAELRAAVLADEGVTEADVTEADVTRLMLDYINIQHSVVMTSVLQVNRHRKRPVKMPRSFMRDAFVYARPSSTLVRSSVR